MTTWLNRHLRGYTFTHTGNPLTVSKIFFMIWFTLYNMYVFLYIHMYNKQRPNTPTFFSNELKNGTWQKLHLVLEILQRSIKFLHVHILKQKMCSFETPIVSTNLNLYTKHCNINTLKWQSTKNDRHFISGRS